MDIAQAQLTTIPATIELSKRVGIRDNLGTIMNRPPVGQGRAAGRHLRRSTLLLPIISEYAAWGDNCMAVGGKSQYLATSNREPPDALQALLKGFRCGVSFMSRVDDLSIGSGEIGVFRDDSTHLDDGAADQLFGGGNSDWFLAYELDRVCERNIPSDRVI